MSVAIHAVLTKDTKGTSTFYSPRGAKRCEKGPAPLMAPSFTNCEKWAAPGANIPETTGCKGNQTTSTVCHRLCSCSTSAITVANTVSHACAALLHPSASHAMCPEPLLLLHLPTLSTLVRARGLMEGSGFPQILEDVQREGLTDVSAVSFQV